RRGEDRPRTHAGEDQQGVRRARLARQTRDPAEDDREHHHRQQRPDDRPDDADRGLLVANGDVAPREHVKQLAIPPQIAPVVLVRASRLEDDFQAHALTNVSRTMASVRRANASSGYSLRSFGPPPPPATHLRRPA